MRNNYTLLFFLLIFQLSMGQFVPREIIRGQIISDNIPIENVTIFNVSTNKGAVSDAVGYFALYAKPTDTLLFSSVIFKSKKLILTENDFKVIVLKIKLDQYINELDEVIVSPTTLTGDLEKDAKNIKVTMVDPKLNSGEISSMEMESDQFSTVKNKAMLPDGSMEYAMDFMKIGKLVGKWLTGDKPKKEVVFTSDKIFQEAVKDKFTYHFFTNTLGLKSDEIGLFLAFCDKDKSVNSLLAVNKEIDLIDYLINKSVEYKKLQKN